MSEWKDEFGVWVSSKGLYAIVRQHGTRGEWLWVAGGGRWKGACGWADSEAKAKARAEVWLAEKRRAPKERAT